MKMKNIKTIGFSFAVALFAASCTDVESINNVDLNGTVKTDEYYAALREWKQTPGLPQVFVWFGQLDRYYAYGVKLVCVVCRIR